MRRTLWVCLWLDSGPPSPDQPFPVPSSPRPSLQPPQRTWQPNGGRRSWENSRAGASLAEGVLCPTFPTFHRNPPRKGSNRRAMSEVPESSVGAGWRERKEIGTLGHLLLLARLQPISSFGTRLLKTPHPSTRPGSGAVRFSRRLQAFSGLLNPFPAFRRQPSTPASAASGAPVGRWARARTAAERDGDNGHVDGEGPGLMRTDTHPPDARSEPWRGPARR